MPQAQLREGFEFVASERVTVSSSRPYVLLHAQRRAGLELERGQERVRGFAFRCCWRRWGAVSRVRDERPVQWGHAALRRGRDAAGVHGLSSCDAGVGRKFQTVHVMLRCRQ